jgi:uridylate kinase
MKYKRVLLKLSGESLAGGGKEGFSGEVLASYARQIRAAVDAGTEIGIVVGGGNIFRGLQGTGKGVDRVRGDRMGMLATVINSLALQNALAAAGAKCKVLTSIRMEPVGELFSKERALEYLAAGYVVIIGGGTGNPYFTTDSAAALRAIEIEAEVLLKGTRVDGVYTADPEKDPSATKFDELSFDEGYERGLKIMDLTAYTLCRENDMPIIVFNMDTEGNLEKVLRGERTGTLIKDR